MKTLALLAALAFATPALAVTDPAPPAPQGDDKARDRPNARGDGEENGCFGQGRSTVGRTSHINGEKISQRKGDNPELNQVWIDMYCEWGESDD